MLHCTEYHGLEYVEPYLRAPHTIIACRLDTEKTLSVMPEVRSVAKTATPGA